MTWPGDTGEREGSAKLWLPPSPISTTDVDDDVWIPAVAAAGMTIISRDQRIQNRLAERAAIKRSAARMFAITTAESLNRWALLEIVVTRWRDMERIVAERPGPFIFKLTRTGRLQQVM